MGWSLTEGQRSYFTYADAGNSLADAAYPYGPPRVDGITTLLENALSGPGFFGGDTTGSPGIGLGYPYSLTMDVIIGHSGNAPLENTVFWASLQRTPAPDCGSTLALGALGLVALGVAKRSFRNL